MIQTPARIRLVFLAAVATLLAGPAYADRLITHDGRILEVTKARQAEDGTYRLTFNSGSFDCPEHLIASVEMEGDMSDYVPKDDRERELLDKGYVRYRGKWLSKAAYRAELKKKAEASRKRTADLALHSNFYDGWTTETRHFKIKTNTSPELLEYYANLLEAYYKLQNKVIGIKPKGALKKLKMQVNIFKSRDEFHELNEAGLKGGVAGYFSGYAEKALNFYHDYEDPTWSDTVSLHECTHLLTFLVDPEFQPQIWINEGVADYYGSSKITFDKKGKVQIEPGNLLMERIFTVQEAMKDGSYIPLATLFRTPKAQYQAFQYAHSWAFVYFLNNNGKQFKKGFQKFFKDYYHVAKDVVTQKPTPTRVAGAGDTVWNFVRCTPEEVERVLLHRLKVKDLGKLEEDWKAFILGIVVDGPQARFKRGYDTISRFELDEFDRAIEDLTAAIDGGVDDARAYWARARARVFKTGGIVTFRDQDGNESMRDMGGQDVILADFSMAVELAPLKSRFRYALGTTMTESALLADDDEMLASAAANMGLASELDPESEFYANEYAEFLADREKD